MKEKTNQSTRPKQMRCKYCGHIQPLSQSFCEECGHDMALYGEVIKEDAGSGSSPLRLPKWVLPGAALLCAVCVIAGLIRFVVPGSENDREPAQIYANTEATTMPETPVPEESTISTEAPVHTEATAPTESPKPVTEEAVLPDFLAFANGFVQEGSLKTYAQRYSYSYFADSDAVRPVFDEYRTLLESRYPYQQIGTCESTDDWQLTYYWYAYTGPSEVTELTMDTRLSGVQIKDCNVWVVFGRSVKDGTVQIFVGGANEVVYRDNGDRTTFQTGNGGPLQVTGIALNCFGLLYDPQDGSQVDWAPQGYTIGYDLSVAYVGEKPGEFDCQVTSSDEGVLQVDGENFRLHAVAPGTATVTASCAGFSDSRNITVYPVNEAAGSSLSFSTPVIEVSGTDPVEVPVTLTMTLGSEAQVVATRYVADKGVTDCQKSGDFIRVDDDVYTMDLILTVDPKALSDTTDSGILAYMLCKDGDNSYDLERDILAYTVISIVKTG